MTTADSTEGAIAATAPGPTNVHLCFTLSRVYNSLTRVPRQMFT